jgi:hypothetical protein
MLASLIGQLRPLEGRYFDLLRGRSPDHQVLQAAQKAVNALVTHRQRELSQCLEMPRDEFARRFMPRKLDSLWFSATGESRPSDFLASILDRIRAGLPAMVAA